MFKGYINGCVSKDLFTHLMTSTTRRVSISHLMTLIKTSSFFSPKNARGRQDREYRSARCTHWKRTVSVFINNSLTYYHEQLKNSNEAFSTR